VKLGAIEILDDGRAVPRVTADQFQNFAKNALDAPAYRRFWHLAQSNVPLGEAIADAFGVTDLSSATRRYLGEKLLNWGRTFEWVPQGRLVHTASSRGRTPRRARAAGMK
jgi:hypothetical protein